ncbi:hypothetical protein Q8A67_025509 [Cirrhinus molitorella]|uniref:Uncharacterized protein n=1 Tax=Cirrhinus molitorella TaxID=172907 RepID=A0AA88NUR0_9TELE|nr:hypothetical protein Q8A67_025509 [Cirrhinus molitorella]
MEENQKTASMPPVAMGQGRSVSVFVFPSAEKKTTAAAQTRRIVMQPSVLANIDANRTGSSSRYKSSLARHSAVCQVSTAGTCDGQRERGRDRERLDGEQGWRRGWHRHCPWVKSRRLLPEGLPPAQIAVGLYLVFR